MVKEISRRGRVSLIDGCRFAGNKVSREKRLRDHESEASFAS